MTYNDILRRFRYALNINDRSMLDMFKLGECPIDLPGLKDLLKKEEEQGYVVCSGKALSSFLDGFVISRRGRQEAGAGQAKRSDSQLTNNAILRKMRIALELKEDDMLGILKLGNITLSKSELSAFFRDKEHKNFKVCGDQVLRNFMNGLAVRHREKADVVAERREETRGSDAKAARCDKKTIDCDREATEKRKRGSNESKVKKVRTLPRTMFDVK